VKDQDRGWKIKGSKRRIIVIGHASHVSSFALTASKNTIVIDNMTSQEREAKPTFMESRESALQNNPADSPNNRVGKRGKKFKSEESKSRYF
jgi:hypothetical protein